jgi:hypothetical protein
VCGVGVCVCPCRRPSQRSGLATDRARPPPRAARRRGRPVGPVRRGARGGPEPPRGHPSAAGGAPGVLEPARVGLRPRAPRLARACGQRSGPQPLGSWRPLISTWPRPGCLGALPRARS